jgi:spoIIIJ-associated protein
MDFIESKGKTVDEAVFSGLMKMDLSIDEIEIEILDEGGSLFKSAKVRLTKKKDASVAGIITDATKKAQNEAVKIEEEKPVERPQAKQRTKPQSRPQSRPQSSPQSTKLSHDRSNSYTRPERPDTGVDVEPTEPQNDAEEFLQGMFKNMGIRVALESVIDEGILKIDMSGRNMGLLIGRRGETLDAMQYLTSLVLNNGKEDYTKVMLDTEEYRKKREDTLKRLAARLAEKVVKSGRRVVLEPMNPYERRILHSTLQDFELIYTYSEGEDPFRSVVVSLKSMKGKEPKVTPQRRRR